MILKIEIIETKKEGTTKYGRIFTNDATLFRDKKAI
jgi:hypothetical protein